jgi:two-component sensor histidine kinase
LLVGTNFLLPIVMIALAWAAIWFVTERQITRWIDYLRRVAIIYRGGHYGARPALEEAPEEFRLLGEAMSEMAAGIEERDTRLREAVAQKTVLIKEVHHRVKNNLQIVMSLLSLQAAQLKDPASRDALNQAQLRINALALVHRILYEIEDQTTVDLRRMLCELTQQVVQGMGSGAARVAVKTDILPRNVTGDIAVPLSLFTVEALTNIFKHAFPPGRGGGTIRVSLREAGGGNLRLAVEDDGVGFGAREDTRGSIGSRLIKTFGQQLGGTTSVRSEPGKGTSVEIVFRDPDAPAPS